jgi:hypothetical protein
MTMRTILLPLCLLSVATPLAAKTPDAATAICAGPIRPTLFLSPMGEPFRPKHAPAAPAPAPIPGDAAQDDPVRGWFDQADRNHDGRIDIAELMLDADRFFALLDKDHDGQLLPEEVAAYEDSVPELRTYQARTPRDGSREDRKEQKRERQAQARPPKLKSGESGYDGAMGAGRFAFLNIPNPVASADADINRAVDRDEFRRAAADRFRQLDPAQKKALTLADLPKTPAQQSANAACLAAQNAEAKGKPRR